MGGFVFCVVLPIPIYATGEPFAGGIGAMEQTILSTAVAYVIVWYCGRRLEAFPRVTLQGNIGYIAPVAAIAYSTIAVLLLLLRSDYSRVQLFGSGFLAILWMAFVGQLKARYLVRNYAVVPSSLVEAMPGLQTCHWLPFEQVERDGIRVDAIVADLGAGLTERQVSSSGGCGHRRRAGARPPLHRRNHDRPHAAWWSHAQRVRRAPAVAAISRGASLGRARADGAVRSALPAVAGIAWRWRSRRATAPGRFSSSRRASAGAAGSFRMIKFRTMFHGVDRAELHGTGRSPHHAGRRVPAPLRGSTSCRSSSTS